MLLLLAVHGAQRSPAQEPSPSGEPAQETADGSRDVELFAAINDGELEAEVVPVDYSRLILRLTNSTTDTIRVTIPPAFGTQPAAGGGELEQDSLYGQVDSQSLAAVVPAPRRRSVDAEDPPLTTVELGPRRTYNRRVPCFCLEFGKPDPTPNIPYEIVPISQLNRQPEIAYLLEGFAADRYEQPIVQLAAWHLIDGVTFEQLAAVRVQRSSGRVVNRFPMRQILEARDLATEVKAQFADRSEGEPGR